MLKPGKVVDYPAAIVVSVFPKPFPYLGRHCPWKLLFESGASLADMAVSLSERLAGEFRMPRVIEDGIGIASAFLKSHVEQNVAKNRELLLAPHCVLY